MAEPSVSKYFRALAVAIHPVSFRRLLDIFFTGQHRTTQFYGHFHLHFCPFDTYQLNAHASLFSFHSLIHSTIQLLNQLEVAPTLIVFYTETNCWQFRVISSDGAASGERKLYYTPEAAERAGRNWIGQGGIVNLMERMQN